MPSSVRSSSSGFTLAELLTVTGILALSLTSLALIHRQARSARKVVQARLRATQSIGAAVSTLAEDIRRASLVPETYGKDRTGGDRLVLVSKGQVLVYTCGAEGLVRRRVSEDGTSGLRTLLPPGTHVSFSFPGRDRRWVEAAIQTGPDRKRKPPPYVLFAGLRGRP